MKSTYQTISLPIDEMFDKIFEDRDLRLAILKNVPAGNRQKLHVAKQRRETLTIDSKRRLLEEFGFEKTQDELWRLKT